MKKALITGITGMDGSMLAEKLLNRGYEVHGIMRRSSSFNTSRIDHIFNDLKLYYGDLTDPLSINDIVTKVQPDELYNLGAMSHVRVSFDIPHYTAQVDALGTLNCLEAIKNYSTHTKMYQASTSELYGGIVENMPKEGYNENSIMHPRSPYGVAKMYGLWIVRNYRESYNIFASNGILFNHCGPRRGKTFLTRKVTHWCGKNYKAITGKNNFEPLQLGNLNAKRDEGHSSDYCDAMHLMLQSEIADDFVVATGETYSVREWVEMCFDYLGEKIYWEGEGLDEVGMLEDGRTAITINPKYFRPAEVDVLLGDSSKIRTTLGWNPKYAARDIVDDMMSYDIEKYGV